MQVRDATADDVVTVAKLGTAAFNDAYGGTAPEEDLQKHLQAYFSAESVALEIQDPTICYLVAMDGETCLGFLKLRDGEKPPLVKAKTALEIQQLYIGVDQQRKGVGYVLIEAASARANKNNVAGLWLSVWHDADWAVNFYEKCGFVALGTYPFWLGSTCFLDKLMWLALEAD